MRKKIFKSIMLVAAVVLCASLSIILSCLYNYFGAIQENQLKDEVHLVGAAVEKNGLDYLEKLDKERYRITWIDSNGEILYDSQADKARMENHLDRTEVQEAFLHGSGESTRYSSTMATAMFYYAEELADGSVIRMSGSRDTTGILLLKLIQPILLILLLAIGLSVFLANRVSRHIIAPLNNLNLEEPLKNDTYDELSPLLNKLHRQHEQIDEQLYLLEEKKAEFTQITDNMKEGLILLNNQKQIISINPSAAKLFHIPSDCAGTNFLTVDRSLLVQNAIQQAMEKGHSEFRTEFNNREYQFDLSQIASGGKPLGTVLLAFDITEQTFAERSRREFTANVSHELKTPLQSIMGSAELMENNLVKKEDMPRFIGHIRTESKRLLDLIENTLRLSKLDENGMLPNETVDLYEVGLQTADSLSQKAEAQHVTLSVYGEHVLISGVKQLLEEILINLLDNAIKYNRENGEVTLHITEEHHSAVIRITDTGIGIPEEEQKRIFERFYRVDKSHSRTSGGTGLGLSIVKHAVLYLNGTITLKSIPNQGTEITINFPLPKDGFQPENSTKQQELT